MTKKDYLTKALDLRTKIEHLHTYADFNGYNQAKTYFNQLEIFMFNVSQSKSGRNVAPSIHSIWKEVQQLMEKWEKEIKSKEKGMP